MVAQMVKFATGTATTIVLARMLTPEDFGLIAMVLAIISFAAMFRDAGLTDATLQRDTITHDQVSTLFWINAGFGLLISIGVAFLAPAIAWFYNDPRLVAVTVALSGMFLIGGLSSQHQALLRRSMRFGSLGIVEIVSAVGALCIALSAAALNAGHWSLVAKHIALATLTTIGCWVAMPWRPGFTRMSDGIGSMLKFGANVSGFNAATYFSRNADNVLIGRFIGAVGLGFYSKAYSLMMLPVSQIRTPITSVGLPALSRLQNDPAKYREYYRKLLQILLLVTTPIGVLLGVHSNEVIYLVLGESWMPVADVFRVFALLILPQTAVGTFGMVMLSCGNAGRFFRLGIFTGIVSVISFIIGLPWGINGVAISYAIANFLVLVPMSWYALEDTPIDVPLFFRSLIIPTVSGVAVALFSRTFFLLLRTHLTIPLALVVCMIPSVLVYFLCYLVLPGGRTILDDLRRSITMLRPKPETAPV